MESALIISNTTPLINFAEIGRMDVLVTLLWQHHHPTCGSC
jgi:predicted nucleic acid-binding protein